MSQSRSVTTPLFRTSLRDWQAAFKAKQAETAPPAVLLDTTSPPRVKRLAARKKKKMRDAMIDSGR
jgi:hypothetical protein